MLSPLLLPMAFGLAGYRLDEKAVVWIAPGDSGRSAPATEGQIFHAAHRERATRATRRADAKSQDGGPRGTRPTLRGSAGLQE